MTATPIQPEHILTDSTPPAGTLPDRSVKHATPLPAPSRIDSPLPEAGTAQTPSSTEAPILNKQRTYQQFDDVYITTSAGELWFIRVRKEGNQTTVGNFHHQPKSENWVLQALLEASRLSRARSTIRIHTTEPDITEAVRFGMRDKARAAFFEVINKDLQRNGKNMVLARPERETPIWRDIMKLIRSGEELLPSVLVTYSVHTAAITDFGNTFCGVILIGQGSVIVHHDTLPGEDLIDAELAMVEWVINQAGGGGRIDIHHASDSAIRIWEQVEALANQKGSGDALAFAGERLRNLVKRAYAQQTQIMVGKRTSPTYTRFAKAAAASAFVGTEIL